jgi:hypothetical protein
MRNAAATPLLAITQRGYFLDAACNVFEGRADAADLRCSDSLSMRSVHAVLFDAKRRAVHMGKTLDQPRSLASEIGVSVTRFLGGSARLDAVIYVPFEIPHHRALECCGALTTDGTLLLHPCSRVVCVLRVRDGSVHSELPYAHAAQVFVAADDSVFIAHEATVTMLGPDFQERCELPPECADPVRVTGVCAGDDVVVRTPCDSVQVLFGKTRPNGYIALARSVFVVVNNDSMAVIPLSQ